jgi:hypothetical protein
MTDTPRWLKDRMTRTLGEVARIRRELRTAIRFKDQMHLQRKLKQAQIDHAYAKHWVTLTE